MTSGAANPSGNTTGYDLEVAVDTPALFTKAVPPFGSWAWLQLCQLNVTTGGGSNSQHMTSPELDSSFPYNTGTAPNGTPGVPLSADTTTAKPHYGNFADTPDEGWGIFDKTVAFNDHFSLYVMFQPPDVGNGVNWVPLDLYSWGYAANITRQNILNNNWNPNPMGSVVDYGKSTGPPYPFWTSKFAP